MRPIVTLVMAVGFSMAFLMPAPASAGEVKQLDRDTVTAITKLLGYTNVVVAAIIPSVGEIGDHSFSGSSVATVIGVGTLDFHSQKIQQTFFYDAELGWFTFEFATDPQNPNGKMLQMWTAQGYKELRPSTPR